MRKCLHRALENYNKVENLFTARRTLSSDYRTLVDISHL